jgi:hypothetical protein
MRCSFRLEQHLRDSRAKVPSGSRKQRNRQEMYQTKQVPKPAELIPGRVRIAFCKNAHHDRSRQPSKYEPGLAYISPMIPFEKTPFKL